MTITIYHNPDCGTSRNTLAMIRASGKEQRVEQRSLIDAQHLQE